MGTAFLSMGKTVVAITADAVVLSVPPKGTIQHARKQQFEVKHVSVNGGAVFGDSTPDPDGTGSSSD